MKRILLVLVPVIFYNLQATITDRSEYVGPLTEQGERYLEYQKPGYTQRRLGFEKQEFRNRTPYDLYIVVYFEGGVVKSLNVPKNSRGILDSDLLCTEYFVVYPTSRLPGEPTPRPTSIYVNECDNRITYIKYDYAGYFYSITAHKI